MAISYAVTVCNEIEEVKRMFQEAETQKMESLQDAIKEDQKINKRPIK